ncbi:exodeoxyribonuclease VII large subunit [Vibrio stylophorae]|nr:exodeoxyribonuclease VII large subunit [Vibrio stylophorae]
MPAYPNSASESNSQIYSVSSLNSKVRLLLEKEVGIIWLAGELTNFSQPVSGHWYFTLKDNQAQVKCAMFRGQNRRVIFAPRNGQQVLVRARISLYEPRGDYQLVIESMQPAGDGLMQQAFEALKIKLYQEGLFDQGRKKPLPQHPRRVGVITSPSGAALHDILNVLKRRAPQLPVVIYPATVQGDGAAITIAQAIGRANSRQECDVLIVGRGGGGAEDLWCFNDEVLARTIAASQIPIISAVGHEVDVTISDFVADLRAPTPSAAAELVSRDQLQLSQQLSQRQQQLRATMQQQLSLQKQHLYRLQQRLERQHPQRQLNQQAQRLDELHYRLSQAMQRQLHQAKLRFNQQQQRFERHHPKHQLPSAQLRLAHLRQALSQVMRQRVGFHQQQLAAKAHTLEAVSPLAILARGFSVSFDSQQQVLRQSAQVQVGERITTQLQDGKIESQVVAIRKNAS